MIRPATAPLFVQALGLVIATLAAAQIAAIIVLVSLPPPPPDAYSVRDVVIALQRTGESASSEGRPLRTVLRDRPPANGATLGRRRLRFRAALATVLRIAPARIVVAQPGVRIVAFADRPPPAPPGMPGLNEQPLLLGGFAVGVERLDGRWLTVRPKETLGLDPWRQRILLVLALAIVAVAPLAWWFARRLAAPLAAFASAAERLGRDPGAPPLALDGPAEVRTAVGAFNLMQERLALYVKDRTAMIGAIAHDLRTPLTRLRFRVEAAPEPLRAKLGADIDEMDAMLAATLAFVRDAARPGPHTRLEMASLVETVIDEAAETGADAAVERAERVVVDGDPLALKRLVANLVSNAVKFGHAARGRVFQEGGMAVVEVDDNGPGMAEADMEAAFEPFRRLESSRSRDTGGIGLGLAVVRAIARAHGGDVALANRSGGGLTARVTLPAG
ncbi:MAG TPA: ATP-binding protein [Caulobacteraceae bacterium]|nr:ATP-binding protein [Caulobacteraceae bacterium]